MRSKIILAMAVFFLFTSIAAAQCCNDLQYLMDLNRSIVNGGGYYPPPFYGGYPNYGYGYGYGPQMGRQERIAVGAGIGAAIGGGASGNWRGSAIGGGIGALMGLAAGRGRNHDRRDQYGGRPEQGQQEICPRGTIPVENQTKMGLEVINNNQYLGILGPQQTLCLSRRGNLVGTARRGSEVRYAEIWTTNSGIAFRAPNN